jgi:hypothetical protein
MTKRVTIASDNVTVANVAALAAGSPAGSGTFQDVADTMIVGPWLDLERQSGSPAYTAPPAPLFSNFVSVQTAAVLTSGGNATVVWAQQFANVPVPLGFEILDPSGAIYTATLTANSTTGLTYAVKKSRTLPAALALLSDL